MDSPSDSYIIIRFSEFGSVIMGSKLENVTPLQIIAAASYLEVMGKNRLLMEEVERSEREAQSKLAVPENKILVGK
jgi:hypothetical protein